MGMAKMAKMTVIEVKEAEQFRVCDACKWRESVVAVRVGGLVINLCEECVLDLVIDLDVKSKRSLIEEFYKQFQVFNGQIFNGQVA